MREILQRPELDTWVGGAVSGGRQRWRKAPESSVALNGLRWYLFPSRDSQSVILIGADKLDQLSNNLWKSLSQGLGALVIRKADKQRNKLKAESAANHLALIGRFIRAVDSFPTGREGAVAAVKEISANWVGIGAEISFQDEQGWFSTQEGHPRPVNPSMVNSAFSATENMVVQQLTMDGAVFGFLKFNMQKKPEDFDNILLVAEILAGILSKLQFHMPCENQTVENP